MKLSEIKRLVSLIEAATLDSNPDPDVQFWIPRASSAECGPLDASTFITMEPATSQGMRNHRVVNAYGAGVVQRTGDFSLPLTVVPFYSRGVLQA